MGMISNENLLFIFLSVLSTFRYIITLDTLFLGSVSFRGNYKLQWEEGGPRTILIIKKPFDEKTDKALLEVAT